jgi:hypothetical protein
MFRPLWAILRSQKYIMRKNYKVRSLVVVHILNFQRDLNADQPYDNEISLKVQKSCKFSEPRGSEHLYLLDTIMMLNCADFNSLMSNCGRIMTDELNRLLTKCVDVYIKIVS